MSISLFVTYLDPAGKRRVQPDDCAATARMIGSIPNMAKGLIFTPLAEKITHPFMGDGSGPVLALQLYFPDLLACERAVSRRGILTELAVGAGLSGLSGLEVTHQIMVTRSFPVDFKEQPPGGATSCSYLVHYPGEAKDLNAWHLHYLEHHPPIMRMFPNVRQIEIYTRVDWVDRLPSRRVEYMQRNKLVFDSPGALSRALTSEVIEPLRADFHQFPPFTGGNKHFPMLTETVWPATS